MVTEKAQSLLNISPDYEPVAKRCLRTKGIAEALPNRPSYVLVVNILH